MQQHPRSNRDGVHNSLSNMLTTICRSWFKKRPNSAKDFVFVSERGLPMVVMKANSVYRGSLHPDKKLEG